MGAVIGKASRGLGTALGNTFVSPIKALFGSNCEGTCNGTWDITCFIEHLCIASLIKLFMISVLSFITLFFIYLLFQVGILQCVCRNACKLTWAGFSAYFKAIEGISCFLWHRLRNTKRVYRNQFEEIEEGFSSSYSSDDSSSSEELQRTRVYRRRRSVRERRKDQMRRSLYLSRLSSKGKSSSNSSNRNSHHHLRVKTREVSLHLKNSRGEHKFAQIQLRRRDQKPFKRRRVR